MQVTELSLLTPLLSLPLSPLTPTALLCITHRHLQTGQTVHVIEAAAVNTHVPFDGEICHDQAPAEVTSFTFCALH